MLAQSCLQRKKCGFQSKNSWTPTHKTKCVQLLWMGFGCPRVDLLGKIDEQQKMRTIINRLPKYCTFDHTFHAMRAEERYWFMKTKPIRHENKTPIELHMTLSAVMRRADTTENVRKDKLKPKDYEALADVIGLSSPLSEGLLAKNGLEKKSRYRTESENLRAAVNAVKVGGSDTKTADGPAK